jgi:branched-chain amino acid transport system permease protein
VSEISTSVDPRGARTERAPDGRLRASAGNALRLLRTPAAAGIAVLLAIAAPMVITSAFHLQVLTVACLNGALAAGLTVSLGYAGLLNFSHGTFYGIGAYVTAVLVTSHGWELETAALAAAAVAGAGGLLLGAVSLRVGGDYFVLVSLAFTVAIFEVMQNWVAVTRGREGFFGIPSQSLFGIPIDNFEKGYYAALFMLVLTVVIVWRFGRTFASRAMLATRFDEAAAAANGIDIRFTKLFAMTFSSALAGLAGSILVATLLFIRPGDFDLLKSWDISLWVIIGGMANLSGVVAIATLLAVVTEGFRSIAEVRIGLMGLLVLVAVFLRGGVFRDVWNQRIARRAARTWKDGTL